MYEITIETGENTTRLNIGSPYSEDVKRQHVHHIVSKTLFYGHIKSDEENNVLVAFIHPDDKAPYTSNIGRFKLVDTFVADGNVLAIYDGALSGARREIEALYNKEGADEEELNARDFYDFKNKGFALHTFSESVKVYQDGSSLIFVDGNISLAEAAKMVEIGKPFRSARPAKTRSYAKHLGFSS